MKVTRPRRTVRTGHAAKRIPAKGMLRDFDLNDAGSTVRLACVSITVKLSGSGVSPMRAAGPVVQRAI